MTLWITPDQKVIDKRFVLEEREEREWFSTSTLQRTVSPCPPFFFFFIFFPHGRIYTVPEKKIAQKFHATLMETETALRSIRSIRWISICFVSPCILQWREETSSSILQLSNSTKKNGNTKRRNARGYWVVLKKKADRPWADEKKSSYPRAAWYLERVLSF